MFFSMSSSLEMHATTCMFHVLYILLYLLAEEIKTSLKIPVAGVSAPAGRDNRRAMRTALACNAVYLIRDGSKPAGAGMY